MTEEEFQKIVEEHQKAQQMEYQKEQDRLEQFKKDGIDINLWPCKYKDCSKKDTCKRFTTNSKDIRESSIQNICCKNESYAHFAKKD